VEIKMVKMGSGLEISVFDSIRPDTYTRALNILAFSAFTALGAHVCIYLPFTPVPITLQTFFVVLSGAFLGIKDGMLSQTVYVLAGLAGVPVFAGGASGPSVVFGPTAGYLAGFIAAPAVTALLSRPACPPGLSSVTAWALRRWRGVLPGFAVFSAGILTIYAAGFFHLIFACGFTPAAALEKGVLPFIPGDVIKSLSAAGLTAGLIPARRWPDD
jgi:biotin transport system substrate-specific component